MGAFEKLESIIKAHRELKESLEKKYEEMKKKKEKAGGKGGKTK